jgi:hypothetical protein
MDQILAVRSNIYDQFHGSNAGQESPQRRAAGKQPQPSKINLSKRCHHIEVSADDLKVAAAALDFLVLLRTALPEAPPA